MSRFIDSEGMDAEPKIIPATQEEVAAEFDRLKAVEDAANKLWPAVRFFGLCGAAPEYISAMVELGRALGKISDGSAGGGAMSAEAIAKIRAQAVRDAVGDIANYIRSGDAARNAVGRRAAEAVADVVADMKLK